MPATSKAQARFMYAVQSGKAHAPGLSKEKAREFTRGVKLSDLPERKMAKKTSNAGILDSMGRAIRAPFRGLNKAMEQPTKKKKSPKAGADKPTTYYDEQGRMKKGVQAGTNNTYIGKGRRRERLPKIQKEAATKKRMRELNNSFKK